MPVSSEQARWAYRLLLGREPENEQVVTDLHGLADVAALRNNFLNSQEYREREGTRSYLSTYLDAPAPKVQVQCTPAEQQAMLDRIADAWARFGESEPHWSVLTNDIYRSGTIEDTIEHFYATGPMDIHVFLRMAERGGTDQTRIKRALDFGCGVGRLTLALAERFPEVVGIDVSAGHLKLARERAEATNVRNVTFEQIGAINDLDRWKGTFDFVLSRIVLQHNPPPIMAALLEKLLDALAKGGTAVIQLPTYIDGQEFVVSDYLANPQPQMEMNALPQPEVFDIIARTGCRVREVREDESIGSIPGISQIFVIGKIA